MNVLNKISMWIKTNIIHDDKEDKESNILEYKILIVGERMVGKTSLCSRFTLNEFNLEIKPTTEIGCYTKKVTLLEQTIKLYLVDIDVNVLSNDHSYLYNDIKGAICTYDITKTKTFEKIENWVLNLKQNSSPNLPILIIGNKTDLSNLRNVDYEEGLEKANSLNCSFCETSCIESHSVKEAFKLLVAKIYYGDLGEGKKNYFKIYFTATSNEDKTEIVDKQID